MTRPTLRTPLCDLLGIEVPILQAGMGRLGTTVTPAELIAAVSEAGGLGCLGAAHLTPEEIADTIDRVRALTDRPFGVDLLVPTTLVDEDVPREEIRRQLREHHPAHWAFVQSLYERFGLEPGPGCPDPYGLSSTLIREQVDVILEARVPVFVSALGDPAWIVPRAHDVGTKVIGVAGAPRHAERQSRSGVDVIIAQGSEAGGHVGSIATLPLVAQVVDEAAPTPVVAAGGIGDGRGVAAALALGAQGVWCGTAFLFAEEANVPGAFRAALTAASSSDVRVSRSYSGKESRSVANPLKDAWEEAGLEPLPIELHMVLMEDLSADAERAGRYDLVENSAGQIVGMLSEHRPARDIVDDLVTGCRAALDRLSPYLEAAPA